MNSRDEYSKDGDADLPTTVRSKNAGLCLYAVQQKRDFDCVRNDTWLETSLDAKDVQEALQIIRFTGCSCRYYDMPSTSGVNFPKTVQKCSKKH